MNKKVYIIHSEYVQNGMTFNSRTRYVEDKEKAIQVYNDTLKQMKEDNQDMISDKENYETNKGGQKANKFFTCYYKYQPQTSNFLVEISAEELEQTMAKTTKEDIEMLAELKKQLSPDVEITISREMAEEICRYCEDEAVYDKLANYGDFYYKLKMKIQQQESEIH